MAIDLNIFLNGYFACFENLNKRKLMNASIDAKYIVVLYPPNNIKIVARKGPIIDDKLKTESNRPLTVAFSMFLSIRYLSPPTYMSDQETPKRI